MVGEGRILCSLRRIKVAPKPVRIVAVAVVPMILASVVGVERWYAGYYLNNDEWGVSARIKTIDPSVHGSMLCEWVCVILSYYPLNWVQVGYAKRPWPIGRDYYVEKNDTIGYDRDFFGTPAADSWHTYNITPGAYGEWMCHIDGDEEADWTTDPEEPVDLQALVESFDTDIEIDGTDFRDISYFNTGNDHWYLWYQCTEVEDDPYYVVYVYDYWFLAWGGG